MHLTKLCVALVSLSVLASANNVLAEDWEYSLSAGMANMPRYSGSNERVTTPVLGGEIISPWGIFLNTEQGLGWRHEWDKASFSAYVGPSDERKDKKSSSHAGSNRLKGMGDIKSRAQFGITGSYDLGPLVLGATLEHALEEDDHNDAGKAFTSLELNVGTNLYEGHYGTLDLSLNTLFGDNNYMQTWYGVTPGQASQSRFQAYDTKGGLVSTGLNLTWAVPISENTKFSTLLDVQYLSKEAGDSPIVERRLQSAVVGKLEYTF
ncbi:MipA/OmpV family protein [Pseudomonas sp. TE50-2]|jgi:outer membrane scaffolding protein for murein synthesis (MipA/OmpV family)|uniref:MipA/OmpV family protein n=1 Tax=Pseudomonas sp. TE50-2 TaxID=3142707 RepID=UPI00346617DD